MKPLIIVLLVVLGLLQYTLWRGEGGLDRVRALSAAKTAQVEENRRLEERNASLAAEVADLKEGFEAIEERARSEMGMIKRDERFYQIIDRYPDP